MTTTYYNGDLCEYTGKTDTMYGAEWYELRYLDGIHKGETRWTQRAPGQASLSAQPKVRSPRIPQL